MKTQSAKEKWKRSEAVNAINGAFWKLAHACEHKHEWDQYLNIIDQEEKDHRRFCPAGVRCGLTRTESKRLFAVKEVFDRFVVHQCDQRIFTPEAKDFFHIKKSVFAACAIADICEDSIRNKFSLDEMRDWLHRIDYAELNKDPRQQKEQVTA